MPSRGSTFALTNAAWTEIKFPFYTRGWSFRVEGGPMLLRGDGPGSIVTLDAGEAVVDAGGGLVSIKATGHGLTEGDTFVIPYGMTTNYTSENDDLVINAASDADTLTFAATYVAETIGTGKYALGYKDIEYPEESNDAENEDVPARMPFFLAKAATATPVTLSVRVVRG